MTGNSLEIQKISRNSFEVQKTIGNAFEVQKTSRNSLEAQKTTRSTPDTSKVSSEPSTSPDTLRGPRKLLLTPTCNRSHVTWLVSSSADSPAPRSAQRLAYPASALRILSVQRFFLLGRPRAIPQALVDQEFSTHGDLLQADFVDSYRNLTLKHLTGLRWASGACASAFLFKSDDDVALDLFALLRLLRSAPARQDAFLGYRLEAQKPRRLPGDKWSVTREEFPDDVYPDFVSGWLYALSFEALRRLVACEASGGTEGANGGRGVQKRGLFWIDDVYVTGILREECGLGLQAVNEVFATDYRLLKCCVRGGRKGLRCEYLVGPDGGRLELQLEFRRFAEACRTGCAERKRGFGVKETCVAEFEEQVARGGGRAVVERI